MSHKAGFVNIIGKPNVGKSTLMNAFIGEHLSIITSKAQTTRHRILGIVNGNDFQVVLSDTPGIITPKYTLHKSMMKQVTTSLKDADIILFVTEVGESYNEEDPTIMKIAKAKVPVLLLINKMDLADEEKVKAKIDYWKEQINVTNIYPISALQKFNVDTVFKKVISLLPKCEPYYPKDAMTDKPEKFFVQEFIREKIFLNYKQEVPYSTEVMVDTFKETEEIIKIRAEIFVNRKSQKPILIGAGGLALKKVGIAARKDIEKFFKKKVYLELFVKVKENWRDREDYLDQFGY